jgi:outer membrane protein assembly factor BamB
MPGIARVGLVALLPATTAIACAGGSAAAPHARTGHAVVTGAQPARSGSSAARRSDRLTPWPTYQRTAGRAGTATGVGASLHRSWTAQLDGGVYGEPVVAGHLLIAATERDTVYALHPHTGKVVWHRHLGHPQPQSGLPCGDIDPLGITGTPAYDAKTGSVFVVTETTGGHHTLWALGAANGHRRWHRSLDVEKHRNRKAEQERSALLVTHHRVITSFGGLAGDCSNYVGYLTSVPTTGKGRTHAYAVPTAREAGMWSPAGPVYDGSDGEVYVASGNGAELHGHWDKSDSVTALDPVTMKRLGVFAPSTWRQDNQDDLDLGSSSPMPVDHRIVIAGKRGTVYLLHRSLGGVGSAVDHTDGCAAYGGAAHRGDVAVMPCRDGVRALRVGRKSLHWRWSTDNIWGSPVIAGRHVYVADRNTGDVFVLSLATGHTVSRVSVGSLTHFPSVVVDDGRVFVPTLSGLVALRGR